MVSARCAIDLWLFRSIVNTFGIHAESGFLCDAVSKVVVHEHGVEVLGRCDESIDLGGGYNHVDDGGCLNLALPRLELKATHDLGELGLVLANSDTIDLPALVRDWRRDRGRRGKPQGGESKTEELHN
jgi:hypothetical protein